MGTGVESPTLRHGPKIENRKSKNPNRALGSANRNRSFEIAQRPVGGGRLHKSKSRCRRSSEAGWAVSKRSKSKLPVRNCKAPGRIHTAPAGAISARGHSTSHSTSRMRFRWGREGLGAGGRVSLQREGGERAHPKFANRKRAFSLFVLGDHPKLQNRKSSPLARRHALSRR